MKILHVVPTYLPATRYGGPIYSVHGLCKALVAIGHEVHVYTTSVDGDQDSDVPLESPVTMDGVAVWYFPSRIIRRLYWSPKMFHRLKSSIASFDVVHLHSVFLWPTWATARLARRFGVPYVMSPRGMLVKDLIQRKSRWLKTAWITLIETRNIRGASLIHFTAGVERDDFAEFGFPVTPYCVVPNGAEFPGLPDDAAVNDDIRIAISGGRYLLFLGRLSWKKGIDRLIEAMPSVPDQRLLIVGNDEEDYAHTIRRLMREHAVDDRVTLVPRFVGGADKQALYGNAILFVLPSYSENFGNTVPEAMAAGCPVVVTPEVGAADLVQAANCGSVATGDELAATLNALLEDRDRLAKLGLAGKVWVAANLSWESVAHSMAEQYRAVLESAPR